MAAEQENSEQASTLLGKHKRQVLAGAAVVLVSLGALWAYLMWGAVKPETVVVEPVIGVLDMQQLIKAHPDYGRLQEIQRDIDHLENSLALEDIKLPQTAPTPEKELFQEAADQKSRLDSLARHDQLVHQLNALAEEKRQELRPKFEAERQEAEQKYLNEMLNLRIKIDSADVLGLTPEQVQEILDICEVKPAVLQTEVHPYSQEKKLKEFLDKEGIVIQAWYPLGHGDKALIQEPLFTEFGKKYGKSNAQIILRWHIQAGNIVIPGSKNPAHIKDNFNLFDFALTDDEMAKITALDKQKRYYTSTPEMLKKYAEMVPPVDEQK